MTSKCFRLLAMMLSVLLVLSAIPIAAYAEALADLSLSASVTDTDSEASRETVIEVPELRTATDKYFLLSNGNYYVARYDTAVHYQDEDGVWQDIDNTLSASGNEISTGDAKIKFAKKTSGNETLFTLHDGNRKLTLSLCGANKKIEGVITNRESELSEDATELQRMTILHKISASVCYPDILTGVDLEYVIKGSDIKENIIVKEASESYAYSFTMALNNLSAETDETGGVLISDSATGELVYTIPAPTMWDANGIASDRVGMTLTPHGNGKYTLTVTADAEWMNAEDRAYPVTIDPPIYTGTAGGVLDLTVSSLTPNAAS